MHRILITSDETHLIGRIGRAFPDFEVDAIQPDRLREPSDAETWCFIDWLLPDMSGLELCRQLRAAPGTSTSHITLVLDDDDAVSRRRALGAGADDYIPGPLTPQVLIDRIKQYTANRPAGQLPISPRGAAGLTLDADAHQVRWDGKLVALRPRELALLQAFIANPDKLLTRAKLISLVGQDCPIEDERTVDVWVGRLRRSLEAQGVPRIVRTVRSHGYVFDTP